MLYTYSYLFLRKFSRQELSLFVNVPYVGVLGCAYAQGASQYPTITTTACTLPSHVNGRGTIAIRSRIMFLAEGGVAILYYF
jgi:hypothetical protein